MSQGWDVMGRDMDKLQKCTQGSLMNFNKAKGRVLVTGQVIMA